MSDGSNYLDPDRPEAVRLSVGNARALGEAATAPRIGKRICWAQRFYSLAGPCSSI